MTLTLFTNLSENNCMDKNLTEITSLTGDLRAESSMIDPVIMIEADADVIAEVNYAYIDEFERWYFVTNIDSVRTGLWRLTMHVDVLYTYAAAIRENYAIIERNEFEYDLELNDGLFKTMQNPQIECYNFPGGFTQWDYVLALAGN